MDRDIDPQDRQSVLTIIGGMFIAAIGLILLSRVLKFRFVLGVGD
jgi:hypothetical protein